MSLYFLFVVLAALLDGVVISTFYVLAAKALLPRDLNALVYLNACASAGFVASLVFGKFVAAKVHACCQLAAWCTSLLLLFWQGRNAVDPIPGWLASGVVLGTLASNLVWLQRTLRDAYCGSEHGAYFLYVPTAIGILLGSFGFILFVEAHVSAPGAVALVVPHKIHVILANYRG